jgi:hypothetical protein
MTHAARTGTSSHLVPIREDERKELVRLKKDVPHDDQTSDEKIKIEAMDIDVCTDSGRPVLEKIRAE